MGRKMLLEYFHASRFLVNWPTTYSPSGQFFLQKSSHKMGEKSKHKIQTGKKKKIKHKIINPNTKGTENFFSSKPIIIMLKKQKQNLFYFFFL